MTSAAWRLVILALCMLGSAALGNRAMRPEQTVLRAALVTMPVEIGAWRGYEAAPFTPEVLEALGVDEYFNRVYVASAQPLSLYVGYYRSQRAGDTIHSPQNCLPGAGWLPVVTARRSIPVAGRPDPILVNRLVIQKGLDRQVVFYWYQSHGRVVASDYLSKAYLVYDALRNNRSDAAMVRVISPVLAGDVDDRAADERAMAFIQSAFPQIDSVLPI